jgi:protein tyrosine/serine phosphatase
MIFIIKKFSKYILLSLLGIALLWASYFLLYGNFHKVDKDIYRSAQLFSFNFPYYIEKYNIRSVINLRGDANKQWYYDEMRIVKEYNLTHNDYHIGDRREASIEEMDNIVQLIRDAPKPLLIHCKAGADRTSLASALYLYAIKKDKNPEREISIIYGHFPWLGSKTRAMDRSFKRYKNAK